MKSTFDNQIMDSFRTFGVSEKTKDVIAIHISEKDSPKPRQILSLIAQIVHGSLEQDGLGALDSWKSEEAQDKSPVNWDLVRKIYKLEGYEDRKQVENLVKSMVAMKSVAA